MESAEELPKFMPSDRDWARLKTSRTRSDRYVSRYAVGKCYKRLLSHLLRTILQMRR